MAFLPAVGTALMSAVGTIAPTLATAGTAAAGATGASTLATGLSAAGSLLGGISGFQQSRYAADQAEINANLARTTGQREEEASKLKYGALGAEQKAAQAANGIDVDSGSAVAVRDSTAAVGALDAAMIHYKAARSAFGYEAQAKLDRAAAIGSLVKGTLGAGNSLLGGSNSLSEKWDAFKTAGVKGY